MGRLYGGLRRVRGRPSRLLGAVGLRWGLATREGSLRRWLGLSRGWMCVQAPGGLRGWYGQAGAQDRRPGQPVRVHRHHWWVLARPGSSVLLAAVQPQRAKSWLCYCADSLAPSNTVVYANDSFCKLVGKACLALHTAPPHQHSVPGRGSSYAGHAARRAFGGPRSGHQASSGSLCRPMAPNLPGHLRGVSRRLDACAGYTEGELLGQSYTTLHGPETDANVALELDEALARGCEAMVELRLHRKDGCAFLSEISVTPVHEGGRLTNFVWVRALHEVKCRGHTSAPTETPMAWQPGQRACMGLDAIGPGKSQCWGQS